jgi:hypothetical protein
VFFAENGRFDMISNFRVELLFDTLDRAVDGRYFFSTSPVVFPILVALVEYIVEMTDVGRVMVFSDASVPDFVSTTDCLSRSVNDSAGVWHCCGVSIAKCGNFLAASSRQLVKLISNRLGSKSKSVPLSTPALAVLEKRGTGGFR